MKIRTQKIKTLAFLAIMSALVLISGCAWPGARAKAEKARPSAVPGVGRTTIRSITLAGNLTYKAKILEDKLGFKVGDYLDPVLAEAGRGIISEFYRKKGFAHNVVMLNTAKVAEGELIYIIDEGPKVRIRSVTFKGNKGIKTADLKKAVKTKTTSWLIRPLTTPKRR